MSLLQSAFWGWLAIAVVLSLLWVYQRSTGRASIVDVAWAIGVGALSILFASTGDGTPERRYFIGALAGIWSLRLSLYLLRRILTLAEDGRYETLRRRWGRRTQLYLFAFFQIQALWSVLFALPMLIASRNAQPWPGVFDIVAVAIWLISIAGETVADRQLAKFRADPSTRGTVCRRGLWYYSRHPNYFFEWIHWWTYVALGWQAPYGWLTLFGPAIMLLFLLKITGVPPTEEQALASRGDAYRAYQKTTNAFFPWPPRTSS